MRYLLRSKNTLIIRGPASVRMISGEATALGKPFDRHARTIIGSEKQLPIESLSEADLQIALGDSGGVEESEGSTIPKSWRLAVDALLEMHEGTVAVIGGTDVGKSTFCVYVCNMLINVGMNLRIIDADIGQADIGPPGTISLAAPTRCLTSLVDLRASKLLFMGHVTPSYVEQRLFEGIGRLTDIDRERRSLTLINTDGWIIGSDAVAYKTSLISSLKPDLAIGISTDDCVSELQSILSISKQRSMLVQAAKKALRRSRSDRRLLRQSKFRRFLDNAGVTQIPLNAAHIWKPRNFPPLQLNVLNPEFKNLLVGLSDQDGFLLQIGILIEVDGRSLRIFSRSAEHVRNVEFGYVHLLQDGTEIGYVDSPA